MGSLSSFAVVKVYDWRNYLSLFPLPLAAVRLLKLCPKLMMLWI